MKWRSFLAAIGSLMGVTIAVGQTPLAKNLLFTPVTPCRIMDTRAGQGFMGAYGPPSFAASEIRFVAVKQSGCFAAMQSGVSVAAFALNVTLVPKSVAVNTVTLWPGNLPRPNTVTISNPNQRVLAQNAIIPSDANGAINVYASDATDLLIDVTGYFSSNASDGLAFYPTGPCRVADTRTANGPFGGPSLAAQGTRSFSIPQSACSIPPAAKAYALNPTVVPPGNLSYLTVFPTGTPQPLTSILNDLDGRILANAGIFQAGNNGSLDIFATQATDVVLDITGYFAAAGGPGSSSLSTVTPCRIGNGAALPAGWTTLTIPSACGNTTQTQAYALTATLTPTAWISVLTLAPTSNSIPPNPGFSNQNALVSGQVVGAGAIIPAGSGGNLSAYVSQSGGSLTVDITGYFLPTPGSGNSVPAVISSPVPGSTLPGATVTFNWNRDSAFPPGAGETYFLMLGTSQGGWNLYQGYVFRIRLRSAIYRQTGTLCGQLFTCRRTPPGWSRPRRVFEPI